MQENLYMTDCIRTFTGKYMNVFDPKPEMLCIEDIAHALSQQPRFGGHLPKHYSVAQHCIACCNMVSGVENKLAALMHDATEAYIMDMPRPIKNRLPDYKEMEQKLMLVIANHFGFKYPVSDEVKQADKKMLQYEWDNLMLGKDTGQLYIYDHGEAKIKFIQLYKHLKHLQDRNIN